MSTLLPHVPAAKMDTRRPPPRLPRDQPPHLDGENGAQPAIHYLDMAAKLDQTVESICSPKCAIVRDMTVYEPGTQATTSRGKVASADREPPLVSTSLAWLDLH